MQECKGGYLWADLCKFSQLLITYDSYYIDSWQFHVTRGTKNKTLAEKKKTQKQVHYLTWS